ncbi:hypothetical protein E4T56_gene18417 [Termitomyces sp. T112]|nr:hypothetical protein E4T56_gene18417 [Termitomyces sp. T112]
MSSPSNPVVSPTDLDEVVVYNSGGEEFERRRRASVRDRSQSSVVVVVDFPGVPKRAKFCPALPKGKGASLAVVWGKRQASPPSGAGPSKGPHGHESSAGPPESSLFSPAPGIPLEQLLSLPTPIPSIMEVFLHKQVEALTTLLAVWEDGERSDGAGEEHFSARGDGASIRGAGLAGASDADGGAACRGSRGAGMSSRGGCIVGGAGGGEAEGGLVGQRGRFGACGNPSLGAGASGPLGRCLRGVCINSGRVDAGVRSSASGVAAGDGAIGEVVGGASATQCGGPGVVVGGGG